MRNTLISTSLSWRGALLGAFGFTTPAPGACGARSIVSLDVGERNTRLTAHMGDRIDITLQTVGPGEYATPPAISSPAVAFVNVDYCGAPVPAGPTQCFHFRASSRGNAIVSFTHTGSNPTVQDTIDVR